jgi:hypothetical protein
MYKTVGSDKQKGDLIRLLTKIRGDTQMQINRQADSQVNS